MVEDDDEVVEVGTGAGVGAAVVEVVVEGVVLVVGRD